MLFIHDFFYAPSSLKVLEFLIEKHQIFCDQLVNSETVLGMGSILMCNKGNKFNNRSVLVVVFSLFLLCSLLLGILFYVSLELSFTSLNVCV